MPQDTWHILQETYPGSGKAAPLTLCGTPRDGGLHKGTWKLEDVDCDKCYEIWLAAANKLPNKE